METTLQTLMVHGRTHVLTPIDRTQNLIEGQEPIPQPNYCGTGLALCGILRKNQSLSQFSENRQAFLELQEELRAIEAAKSKENKAKSKSKK